MNFKPETIGKLLFYTLEEFKTLEQSGAGIDNALSCAMFGVLNEEEFENMELYHFTLAILNSFLKESESN